MTRIEPDRSAAAEETARAEDGPDLLVQAIRAALGVGGRTAGRWEEDRAPVRGEESRELRHLLGTVFEHEQDAYAWLHAPVPAFRGRSPISWIREGKAGRVIEALATLASGAFL